MKANITVITIGIITLISYLLNIIYVCIVGINIFNTIIAWIICIMLSVTTIILGLRKTTKEKSGLKKDFKKDD